MFYLVANLLGLIGLVGVFYLTGWLVDLKLMRGRGLAPVAIAGWFGLGTAVWMGLVFVLATLQLLRAPTLGLLLLLLLVVVWRARRTTEVGFLSARIEGTIAGDGPASWMQALLLGVVLLALWVQAQWPQIAWDADAYHLTVPRLYLEKGGFYRIPFNVYSNWPLNTQLLFAMALLVKDYILAKLLHFTFGLATLLLIYRVVSRSSRSWAGWMAAGLFLANPVVLDEFRVAYVDLAFAFFLLLAFVFVHHALEGDEDKGRRLILAGVFGGVAAGVKPTGVIGVVCLAILYLVVTVRRGQGAGEAARGLTKLLVPAGLLLVPWALKSWLLTGNPTYPFLYGLFGGPEWSAELGVQLREWQQGIGMGRGWVDYLLLPFRAIVSGGSSYDQFDGRILPAWLVLIPLALLMRKRQPLIGRCLGVVAVYFLFWALSSQQMRFLIPVLPLLAIASSLALVELARRFSPAGEPAIRWGASLAMVGLLAMVGSQLGTRPWGMMKRFLESSEEVRTEAIHPVFGYIENELPPNARMMFLNTNHGFFCQREFLADSFFEASQINALFQGEDRRGIGEVIQEHQISHLLIENRERYIPWPRSLFEYLNDPDSVRQIYRSPDDVYDVVEILGASPPPGD